MSATFDTDEFANYFKNFTGQKNIPASLVPIKRSPVSYQVTISYLDQLANAKPNAEFVIEKPQIEESTYNSLTTLVNTMDRMEMNNTTEEGHIKIGSVLVFLPGIYEIEEAFRRLTLKAKA